MAVRKTLPLPRAGARFLCINILLVTLYNPSPLSAVALIGSPEFPLAFRAVVLATYTAALLVLCRQAWCGFRALGAVTSAFLVLGLTALVWTLADALLATFAGVVATVILVGSILLSVGQVAAYYARQFSGQSPCLKVPP